MDISTAKKQFETVIHMLINGGDLEHVQAKKVFTSLLDRELGEANETSLGAFLAAMQTKGPTVPELTALLSVVLEHDGSVNESTANNLYGIVGSGKDEVKTYNVSTCATFVAAVAGVPVVKNGSRSDTSLAGTTDILESLGVNVSLSPAEAVTILGKLGVTFIDAESSFPRMCTEYVGKVLFKNPLSYTLSMASGIPFKNMVFGISFDETDQVANTLREAGMCRCIVAAGHDANGKHFDELSSIGPTKISELVEGEIRTCIIKPEDVGLPIGEYLPIAQADTLEEAKSMFLSVLRGEAPSETSDIVALNAAALLYIADKAPSLREAVTMAQQIISTSEAGKLFAKFTALTHEIS